MRTTFAELFTPKLIELVRSITCDNGMTRKDLWRLHDGVLVESVLMRYTDRAATGLYLIASRLRNELPFLRHGLSRSYAQL